MFNEIIIGHLHSNNASAIHWHAHSHIHMNHYTKKAYRILFYSCHERFDAPHTSWMLALHRIEDEMWAVKNVIHTRITRIYRTLTHAHREMSRS